MKKILTLLMGVFALASSVQAQTTFTIVNNNPTEWSQLALYEWHDGAAQHLATGRERYFTTARI